MVFTNSTKKTYTHYKSARRVSRERIAQWLKAAENRLRSLGDHPVGGWTTAYGAAVSGRSTHGAATWNHPKRTLQLSIIG